MLYMQIQCYSNSSKRTIPCYYYPCLCWFLETIWVFAGKKWCHWCKQCHYLSRRAKKLKDVRLDFLSKSEHFYLFVIHDRMMERLMDTPMNLISKISNLKNSHTETWPYTHILHTYLIVTLPVSYGVHVALHTWLWHCQCPVVSMWHYIPDCDIASVLWCPCGTTYLIVTLPVSCGVHVALHTWLWHCQCPVVSM